MTFPFESLGTTLSGIGMIVALLIGFGFGFVLERAGFGRANKLAAQFYLYDMTVFKVMFGAIVTAMLGVLVASGLGLVDLAALSEGAVSSTYIWPMLVGGFVLGAGFIISGYCPGTSLVAMASGNLDGLVTVLGVIFGTLIFADTRPLLGSFYTSGDKGPYFLYQWLHLSPAVVGIAVAVIAVACFVGAEWVERVMTKRVKVAATVVDEELRSAPAPRRFAFGVYAVVAVVALGTLLFPVGRTAKASPAQAERVSVAALAHRVLEQPWTLRILDVRESEACAAATIPGAECVAATKLGELELGSAAGVRELVLVTTDGQGELPSAVASYPGRVALLEGGFAAWKDFALTPPAAPAQNATATELDEYRFRAAVVAALSGRKSAPPPAGGAGGAAGPAKKKKGGGCSG